MKKATVLLLSVFLLFAFSANTAEAATKTIKSTTYSQVIKKGKTAYCAGAGGIYVVKLKNGKVKSKRMLFKSEPYSSIDTMMKNGKYIYFSYNGNSGCEGYIVRVNIKTGKSKKLTVWNPAGGSIAIKNNKLYVQYFDEYYGKTIVKRMKLNGKSKKRVSTKIIMKNKKTNCKGYSIKMKCFRRDDYEYAKDYLVTPKGKYFLRKSIIGG